MPQCGELRREFQCSYFGFEQESQKSFVLSQCGPRLFYPIWTGLWLIYHIVWYALDINDSFEGDANGDPYYFIFLTNWGYILVGVYNLIDFIVTFYVHVKRNDLIRSEKSDEEIPTPWYVKFLWCVFSINNSVAILITIAYYGLLSADFSAVSVEKHLNNSVYVILNLFVSAKPVRLLHFVYPLIFAIVYSIFSVIYQVGGSGSAIYPVLDWDKAGDTIVYVLILVLIGIPVAHIMIFALSKLRNFIYNQTCNRRNFIDQSTERTVIRTDDQRTTSYM